MAVAEPTLRITSGALAAEDWLIDEALRAADEALERGALGAPVVIVVPSASLRQHVVARLAQRREALLGVVCTTHFGLALRVLENRGSVPPLGLDLFPILARRFARLEPALASSLDSLRDGYSGILGAVRDLLDAGFESAHLGAVEEAFESEGPEVASSEEIERASALARVTARVRAAFEELGVGRTSTLLESATASVLSEPERALEVDRVMVHGFADATGVATDFLQALLQTYGGVAVIDRPPDPVAPGSIDPSAEFTDRLAARFDSVAALDRGTAAAPATHIELFRALGREGEVTELAHRCLDLVAQGVAPEAIGIVMRDPRPYVTLIRSCFDELALPFSGAGLLGPSGAAGRRLRALVEIVLRGGRTHVERWLDTLSERIEGSALFDLRVALAALGVSRLEELVQLDVEPMLHRDTYALPVRQGFYEAEEEGEGRRVVRTRRRRVPGRALRRLAADATAICELFDEWSRKPRPLDEHAGSVERLAGLLDWSEGQGATRELSRLLELLAAAPPIEVDRDEFALTFERLARDAGRGAFGGEGGGVQVLSVVDARGRTFEHLFLLGMNRGAFPRVVREDPVLSDGLRKVLERRGHGLLPDLPIKRRGYDEERYLFAQLLSSSPDVTLSWLELDDEDRPAAPSPLVERLRWCHPDRPESWVAPRLVGRQPVLDLDGAAAPEHRLARLSPRQLAVLTALHGRQSHLPGVLPPLFARAVEPPSGVDATAVAAARLAILEEYDPSTAKAARSCLSPYLGLVGEAVSDEDPRRNRRLYVTLLERMSVCPWQTFIERILRVEAVPDPLEALPRIDGLLIGILVHAVLERIVSAALPERKAELGELVQGESIDVPWPEAAWLEEVTAEEARRVALASGIGLEGFGQALAAVVRPYLERARRIEWGDSGLETLAAEIEGHLDVEPPDLATRRIAFRADRVDPAPEGLLLTDYKTGASPFTQKTPTYRYKKLLGEVRKGRRLQPIVYALAAEGDAPGLGRFSFLRPRLEGPEESRSVSVTSADETLRAAFESAIATTLRAWEAGAFFPRLEEPGEPQKAPNACRWCRVAEACVKQDSGARRRLRLGMESLAERPSGEPLHQALVEHWWLPAGQPRGGGR